MPVLYDSKNEFAVANRLRPCFGDKPLGLRGERFSRCSGRRG